MSSGAEKYRYIVSKPMSYFSLIHDFYSLLLTLNQFKRFLLALLIAKS